jgi:hypothetical protein
MISATKMEVDGLRSYASVSRCSVIDSNGFLVDYASSPQISQRSLCLCLKYCIANSHLRRPSVAS